MKRLRGALLFGLTFTLMANAEVPEDTKGKLPNGNYSTIQKIDPELLRRHSERLREIYQPQPKLMMEYVERMDVGLNKYAGMVDELLGHEFTQKSPFSGLAAGSDGVPQTLLERKDEFKKMAENEREALKSLMKNVQELRRLAEANGGKEVKGVMDKFQKVSEEMAKVAGMGEKTQDFVGKYLGALGRSAIREVKKDKASIEQVAEALRQSNQFADFRDLARQVDNERLRLQALQATMDSTATGYFVQAKLEKLLDSNEFCTAAKNCADGKASKNAPKLDGLFERKTHK